MDSFYESWLQALTVLVITVDAAFSVIDKLFVFESWICAGIWGVSRDKIHSISFLAWLDLGKVVKFWGLVGFQLLELHHVAADHLASTAGRDLAQRVDALHTLVAWLIIVFANWAQDILLCQYSRFKIGLSRPPNLVRRVRRISDGLMLALLARVLLLLLSWFALMRVLLFWGHYHT